MKHFARFIGLGLLYCMAISCATLHANDTEEVKVTKQEDGSVSIRAVGYQAIISANGLLSLYVDDNIVLEGGYGAWIKRQWQLWPDTPKPTVNAYGSVVAVRSGDRRIEYTFAPTTIGLETEGYELLFTYNPEIVTSVTVPGHKGGPLGPRKGYSGTTGMILNNGRMISYSTPLHVGYQLTPRVVPTNYLNGATKRGNLLKVTFKFEDASVAQGIGAVVIRKQGMSYGDLVKDGSVGQGLKHFTQPDEITLQASQSNTSSTDSDTITYELTVRNHYYQGKAVHRDRASATIKAGQTHTQHWSIPRLEPGFYYATVTATLDGKELTRTEDVLAIALPQYRPALTRPEDFSAFWKNKLADMRRRPFNVQLTELENRGSTTHRVYRIEFDRHDGQRISGTLTVPREPGKHLASLRAKHDGIVLDVAWPEKATFRTWRNRDDNNLLECILLARRCLDYLKSRPDVDRLFLAGASRGGPINWVAAALDPDKIVGLSIHVPTSFGCSWIDKKYVGWGGKPADMSWKQYTSMAAYVDPVNHAPNMVVPFINAYGDQDKLAPPPGIEAAFQLSPAKWKRMSRDGGGHTRTPGFRRLQKEFAEYLKTATPAGGDDRILKEH